MTFQNYFYTPQESAGDMISYEEQLLLNYDNYLEGRFVKPNVSNHYNLELDELNEEKPGTFQVNN